MQQLTLMLDPQLQRSRSLRDHMATRVYQRGLVDVAGKMDLSPSKLTEKLAGSDSGGKPRGMTIDELETYMQRTGDISPAHYLADKYLRDPAVAQQEALAKLAALAEVIPGLMAAAGLQVGKAKR